MKVLGISFALAACAAVGLIATFNLTDDRRQTVIPTPPSTMQPRAVRMPTETPLPATPVASPSAGLVSPPTATVSELTPALVRLGGDRTMGRALAAPEAAGGTLVLGVSDAPSSLNPLLAGPQPVDSIRHALFEPLVEAHPDTLAPVGVLAESWSVDARGTTWTFNLRAGVTWHDGQPLRAADVVFSLRRYLDPELGHPIAEQLAEVVVDIQAEGELAVRVTTAEPFADLAVTLGVLPIVAEHIFAGVPAEYLPVHGGATGAVAAAVVGTGPFRFVSRSEDGSIRAEAFPDYWDGAPVLAGLVAQPVASQAEMIEFLRASEIDVGTLSAGSAAAFGGLAMRIVDYPLTGFTMLGFNLNANTTPIFQDVRVRQALLLALDREGMAADIRFGYADVPEGTLPVNSWAREAGPVAANYAYDPALARSLLDAAGWTTGVDGARTRAGRALSFRLLTNSENTIRIEYLEQIQEQWSAIGVGVELVVEPFVDVERRLVETGDFDAFLLGYSWGLSPDQAAVWSCAGGRPAANYTGYCNPGVDNLLVRARRELDVDARAALYQEIQTLVLEDLPLAILDFPRGLTGVAERAHNVYPNGVNLYFNAETWWLE
jgi:peptide/nickel transport system substrate-binding protein